MDKTTLVKHDVEVEGRILDALNREKVPVKSVDWEYVPEMEELQLFVVTPLYDDKGPLEALSRVIKALEKAGIYAHTPIRRVSVLSPKDNLAKSLEDRIKTQTEGAIHILTNELGKPDLDREYSVIFAPFTGLGGFVPARHITGQRDLRKFLADRLHIGQASVEEALSELQRKGHTSIFSVQLTNREAKRLGLA